MPVNAIYLPVTLWLYGSRRNNDRLENGTDRMEAGHESRLDKPKSRRKWALTGLIGRFRGLARSNSAQVAIAHRVGAEDAPAMLEELLVLLLILSICLTPVPRAVAGQVAESF